jgi:hypothetical protein
MQKEHTELIAATIHGQAGTLISRYLQSVIDDPDAEINPAMLSRAIDYCKMNRVTDDPNRPGPAQDVEKKLGEVPPLPHPFESIKDEIK